MVPRSGQRRMPTCIMPTTDFVQRFMDHVCKTGEPETFETIDLSWSPERSWYDAGLRCRFAQSARRSHDCELLVGLSNL